MESYVATACKSIYQIQLIFSVERCGGDKTGVQARLVRLEWVSEWVCELVREEISVWMSWVGVTKSGIAGFLSATLWVPRIWWLSCFAKTCDHGFLFCRVGGLAYCRGLPNGHLRGNDQSETWTCPLSHPLDVHTPAFVHRRFWTNQAYYYSTHQPTNEPRINESKNNQSTNKQYTHNQTLYIIRKQYNQQNINKRFLFLCQSIPILTILLSGEPTGRLHCIYTF